MMDLSKATPEELRAELERREKVGKRPVKLGAINMTKVIKLVEDHVNQVATDGYGFKDFSHYLSEEALIAVYGPTVFDWLRQNKKGE